MHDCYPAWLCPALFPTHHPGAGRGEEWAGCPGGGCVARSSGPDAILHARSCDESKRECLLLTPAIKAGWLLLHRCRSS